MDPTETIADTGFAFDPTSSELPWPLAWLEDLPNRAATIHLHASELPHFAAQQEWLCLLDGALHIIAEIPLIGWLLDDGLVAALHYRLCQHATIGHLQRHPEDWQPCWPGTKPPPPSMPIQWFIVETRLDWEESCGRDVDLA